MRRTPLDLIALTLAISLAGIGCGTPETTAESADHVVATGQASLPLVARGESGIRYRLRPAEFIVTGPDGERSVDAGAEDTLVLDLAPGDYTIALQEGWRVAAEGPDGGWVAQPAVLQSANPQAFTVTEQGTTALAFRFGVGPDAIAFGLGRARIDIEIAETPTPEGGGEQDPGDGQGVQPGAMITDVTGEFPCPGYAGPGVCFFADDVVEGLPVATLLLEGAIVGGDGMVLGGPDMLWTLVDAAGVERTFGTGATISVQIGAEAFPAARTNFTLRLSGIDALGDPQVMEQTLAIDVLY